MLTAARHVAPDTQSHRDVLCQFARIALSPHMNPSPLSEHSEIVQKGLNW